MNKSLGGTCVPGLPCRLKYGSVPSIRIGGYPEAKKNLGDHWFPDKSCCSTFQLSESPDSDTTPGQFPASPSFSPSMWTIPPTGKGIIPFVLSDGQHSFRICRCNRHVGKTCRKKSEKSTRFHGALRILINAGFKYTFSRPTFIDSSTPIFSNCLK